MTVRGIMRCNRDTFKAQGGHFEFGLGVVYVFFGEHCVKAININERTAERIDDVIDVCYTFYENLTREAMVESGFAIR